MVMGFLRCSGRFFAVCPCLVGSPAELRSRHARPHPASRRFERVAGMIVTRIGVGKGASRAVASASRLPSRCRSLRRASLHDIEKIKTAPKRCRVINPTRTPTIVAMWGLMESIMDETTRVVAHAELPKHYGSDPVRFSGHPDALLERHLLFNDLIDPSFAGTRQTFEA